MGSAFLRLCCASVWAVCRWQRTAACLPLFSALWTGHHAGGTGHCCTGLSVCRASRPWSWRLMSAPAICDRYEGMIVPYMPESLPAADAGEYATCAVGLSWFPRFCLASHTFRRGTFGSPFASKRLRQEGEAHLRPSSMRSRPQPVLTACYSVLSFHASLLLRSCLAFLLSGAVRRPSSHTCRGRCSRTKS